MVDYNIVTSESILYLTITNDFPDNQCTKYWYQIRLCHF